MVLLVSVVMEELEVHLLSQAHLLPMLEAVEAVVE
jgi:hypothetical protein